MPIDGAEDTGGPKITEKYQQLLFDFLQEIPAEGGPEIPSGTPSLATPFDAAKIDALKDIKTDPRFYKYTGWQHEALLRKWLVDRTTTCNEFCQKCALAMGYTSSDGIGRFDIADVLNAKGLGHVWVAADSGSVPDYGDIFRLYDSTPDENGMSLNHMAVSLYLRGKEWHTVESGQGGPSKGHDAIRRRKREWPSRGLRGWVSMKSLLSAGKPIPHWLGGWWEVQEDPYETWYYYFAAGGKVTCTSTRPFAIKLAPTFSPVLGGFVSKGMYGIDISWRSSDVDERLTLTIQDAKKQRFLMEGKTAKGNVLKATRLLPKEGFS